MNASEAISQMLVEYYDHRRESLGTFCREDMCLILLEGDPIPWTSAEGGEAYLDWAEGRLKRGYSDLTLTRIRSDASVYELFDHIQYVGKSRTAVLFHYTADGTPSGKGLAYYGTLSRVVPTGWDANSSRIASDHVVLKPTMVSSL